MHFHTEKINGILIVQLPGNFDADNTRAFKQRMIPFVQSNMKIVFDMNRVENVDSSGIGAILSCLRRVRGKNGELKLCRLHRKIEELFRLMCLDRALDIFPSRQEAIDAFHQVRIHS